MVDGVDLMNYAQKVSIYLQGPRKSSIRLPYALSTRLLEYPCCSCGFQSLEQEDKCRFLRSPQIGQDIRRRRMHYLTFDIWSWLMNIRSLRYLEPVPGESVSYRTQVHLRYFFANPSKILRKTCLLRSVRFEPRDLEVVLLYICEGVYGLEYKFPQRMSSKRKKTSRRVQYLLWPFFSLEQHPDDHIRVINRLSRPIATVGKIYLRSAQLLQESQHLSPRQSTPEHLSQIFSTTPLRSVWALNLISLFAAVCRYRVERKKKTSCVNI